MEFTKIIKIVVIIAVDGLKTKMYLTNVNAIILIFLIISMIQLNQITFNERELIRNEEII